MFEITLNGIRVTYAGRHLRRAPPRDSDYIELNAGQSTSATVDVEKAYGLSKRGNYSIKYFDNQAPYRHSNTVTLTLVDDRIVAKVEKRSSQFLGCSATQINTLNNDVNTAEPMTRKAFADLENAPVSERAEAPRYGRWFGAYSAARYQTVLNTVKASYLALQDKTLSFECNSRCGELASVDPSRPNEIRVCNSYFAQPAVSSQARPDESRAGTLVHEVTHFAVVGDTDDFAYFTNDSLRLARDRPDRAINNADNYYFFVENVFPPLPMPAPVDVVSPENMNNKLAALVSILSLLLD